MRVVLRCRCEPAGESARVLSRIAEFLRDVLGGAAFVSS
jgi:hypothetical protein